MSVMSFMARRFVAGENMEVATRAVQELNKDGLRATMDLLGENVTNQAESEAAAAEYVSLLNEISARGIDSNVSLKITQLGIDIGEDLCFRLMTQILEHADRSKNFVRMDMEGSPYTERTLRLFQKLREQHENVGIVLQSYLYRGEEDARLLGKLKAPVRVCKGAYKESSAIAYPNMDDIRRSFRTMVEILLQAGSHVAVATHDESLIRWAIDWTTKNQISPERFEFQMLYGLRRKRARELARQGYCVRSYVPYGTNWLPYFVRRLRERKENVFFVLKSLVAD